MTTWQTEQNWASDPTCFKFSKLKPINPFLQDDAFDSSRPGRGSALLPDSAMSSALMDSLQERLKLREGEVVQLQMEVTSLERVREAMTTELAKASEAANEAAGLRERVDALSAQYSETEQKYQTMLTVSSKLFIPLISVEFWQKNSPCDLISLFFRCTARRSRKPRSFGWICLTWRRCTRFKYKTSSSQQCKSDISNIS